MAVVSGLGFALILLLVSCANIGYVCEVWMVGVAGMGQFHMQWEIHQFHKGLKVPHSNHPNPKITFFELNKSLF